MSTRRQQQLIQAIRDMNAAEEPITYDRLCERIGMVSKGGVSRLLNLLRKEGRVDWHPRQHGTLRLVEGPSRAEMERWSDEELARVAYDAFQIEAARSAARVAA
ncbi:hypothetical protein [Caulobacter sp. RHG1]|uniref:hypothetical protein n=1 Tax=Caulobacter sp. (strain RHG1) TaxID=2545762 RepID=UPI0015570073|nr:hypothetical protein [Caulobacter sp. RHG1]NQE62932.1 hypothetical protein [Caulobacter sp. RHG1]